MARTVIIDCYGHQSTDTERFRKVQEPVDDVQEDSSGNVYMRFGTGENCVVHKITTTSGVVHRWAYGSWVGRENLTYSAGVQETLAITVED